MEILLSSFAVLSFNNRTASLILIFGGVEQICEYGLGHD
jgi:hypothetical protein